MKRSRFGAFSLYPPGSRGSNKNWFAIGPIRGSTREVSTGAKDEAQAIQFLERLVARMDGDGTPETHASLPKWARRLRTASIERARIRGIPHTLSESDALALVNRAGGFCEVTGLKFDMSPAQSQRRPFAPSLDRIVPSAGYSLSNCRLVLFAVNVAMSDWGEQVFSTIARAYAGRNAGKLKITQ